VNRRFQRLPWLFHAVPLHFKIALIASLIAMAIAFFLKSQNVQHRLYFQCLNSNVAPHMLEANPISSRFEDSPIARDRRFRELDLGINWSHLRTYNVLRPLNLTSPMFVSGTFVTTDTLILASMKELWEVNLNSGRIREIEPTATGASNTHEFTKKYGWVPTGIYWHEGTQRLFVANYSANNLLVFKYAPKAETVSLDSVVSSEHIKSPENIHVSDDGNYLVAANYEGNGVVAFKKDAQKNWSEIWFAQIRRAHGVSIVKNKVFATGLEERKLYELDLEHGSVLRSIGGIGWDPAAPTFLWPTSVQPVGEDRVILSDAHTGFISIFSTSSLENEGFFGGNGPTLHFFNMPYAAISKHGKIAVLSTFQGRITILDLARMSVLKDFVPQGSDWSHIHPLIQSGQIKEEDIKPTYRLGYKDYSWVKGPRVFLFGRVFAMGYASLSHGKFSLRMPVLRPNEGGVMNNASYYYFLDGYKGEKGLFLFSWSGRQLLYFHQIEGVTYAVPYTLNDVAWRIGRNLITSSVVVHIADIEKELLMNIEKMRASRIQEKIVPWTAITEIVLKDHAGKMDGSQAKERLREKLANLYHSQLGGKFVSAYLECRHRSCNAIELQHLARQVQEEIIDNQDIDLESFVLPGMLASVPCDLEYSEL
jgi:lactonase family protein with 7-bladed beta-propeller